MQVVVLAVSQKWQDEELIRKALRKLHDHSPEATLRLPDPATGAAKDAREFADALGFVIEKWKADRRWQKYPTEIRNTGLLTGVEIVPLRCADCGGGPHGEHIGPPADLVMAFWCGTSDNVKDLIDRRLVSGNPVVAYRENWSKKKGHDPIFQGVERAENDRRIKHRLTPWKAVLQEVKEAA